MAYLFESTSKRKKKKLKQNRKSSYGSMLFNEVDSADNKEWKHQEYARTNSKTLRQDHSGGVLGSVATIDISRALETCLDQVQTPPQKSKKNKQKQKRANAFFHPQHQQQQQQYEQDSDSGGGANFPSISKKKHSNQSDRGPLQYARQQQQVNRSSLSPAHRTTSSDKGKAFVQQGKAVKSACFHNISLKTKDPPTVWGDASMKTLRSQKKNCENKKRTRNSTPIPTPTIDHVVYNCSDDGNKDEDDSVTIVAAQVQVSPYMAACRAPYELDNDDDDDSDVVSSSRDTNNKWNFKYDQEVKESDLDSIKATVGEDDEYYDDTTTIGENRNSSHTYKDHPSGNQNGSITANKYTDSKVKNRSLSADTQSTHTLTRHSALERPRPNRTPKCKPSVNFASGDLYDSSPSSSPTRAILCDVDDPIVSRPRHPSGDTSTTVASARPSANNQMAKFDDTPDGSPPQRSPQQQPQPKLRITKVNIVGNKKKLAATKILPGSSLTKEKRHNYNKQCTQHIRNENENDSIESFSQELQTRQRRVRKNGNEEWIEEQSTLQPKRHQRNVYGNSNKNLGIGRHGHSVGIDPSGFHTKPLQQAKEKHYDYSTRKTRSSTRKAGKKTNVTVTIDSSSEEEEFDKDLGTGATNQLSRVEESVEVSAVRIAIGKKVYHSECRLLLHFGGPKKVDFIELSYMKDQKPKPGLSSLTGTKARSVRTVHTIQCNDDSIEELKYFIPKDEEIDDNNTSNDRGSSPNIHDLQTPHSQPELFDESDHVSFLAMRIKPKDKNGLTSISRSYLQTLDGTSKHNRAAEMKYIVVEVRSDKEFKDLLSNMIKDDNLRAFLDATTSVKLTEDQVGEYAAALVQESQKEKKERELSLVPTRRTRSKNKHRPKMAKSGDDDEILVVYPFPMSVQEIAKTTMGLEEARGVYFDKKNSDSSSAERTNEEIYYGPKLQEIESEEEVDADSVKDDVEDGESKSRTHVLTIRGEDRTRLAPGEFLNDTLIDFWMQWIWRKEDMSTESTNVHFFTSHFFTTLAKAGPSGVNSWTARKKINIFEKSFIFIPINKSLHWSLCVVVNPGEITKCHDDFKTKASDKFPCILFFDSLKAHKKNKVAKVVREWLNSEWGRIYPELKEYTFTTKTMGVFDPKVPYQDNSCDCGVFVCRYAFGLYSLVNTGISFGDAHALQPFANAITDSKHFRFDMRLIHCMRQDMMELIDRLAAKFRIWKNLEKTESKRTEKRNN